MRSQLGASRAAGDSGYRGTNPPAAEKGIFVRPRCSVDALALASCAAAHSLCMSRTFQIMSFLSKGRKKEERDSGRVRLSLAEWNHNVEALKAARKRRHCGVI